jgi:signal transduction histidine kinase
MPRLTLKRQLAIASLLVLLIPWAGLQFVLELDQALREQATSQLASQARRIESVLAQTSDKRLSLPPTSASILYAEALDRPLYLDGYSDDWPGGTTTLQGDSAFIDSAFNDGDQPVQWRAAVDSRFLYLLIRVRTAPGAYFNPGQPQQPHAQIRIYVNAADSTEWRTDIIRTSAPGPVVSQPETESETGQRNFRISGNWQSKGTGYQLELRMPRPAINTPIGFEVRHPSPEAEDRYRVFGNAGPGADGRLPRLLYPPAKLGATVRPLLASGQRALLLDSHGWVLASPQTPVTPAADFDALGPWEIVEQIGLNGLRALLRQFQPEPMTLAERATRYDVASIPKQGLIRHQGEESALIHRLTVSAPDGAPMTLLLEQSLRDILALSGDTLGRVIVRSVVFVGLLVLVLLGYASWLSWRITRLQRAVNASFDTDGRVVKPMMPSAAQDELGDLSRQFGLLIDNLRGYTDYLESFARKLSHELKTPVAVVRSSLENLRHEKDQSTHSPYIDRAQQATDRLSQILQGMSEAARLEKSFDQVEQERFDLAAVVQEATAAYQSLDPDHRITYQGPPSGAWMRGSPELMVQLLDKLVDNARDFTPAQGVIDICVATTTDSLSLQVFNAGPPLPAHLSSEIFSAFVSLRDGAAEGHIGQGLQMVRLIAAHHGGQVSARNQNEPAGVVFEVILPL